MGQKSKYYTVGSILKAKGDKGNYIRVEKDLELLVNGAKLERPYMNLVKPLDEIDFLLKEGYIDKDAADRRRNEVTNNNTRVKVKIADESIILGEVVNGENSKYIKLSEGVDLNVNGLPVFGRWFLNTPESDVRNALENGRISEERAEEWLNSIPEWVKYNITGSFSKSK